MRSRVVTALLVGTACCFGSGLYLWLRSGRRGDDDDEEGERRRLLVNDGERSEEREQREQREEREAPLSVSARDTHAAAVRQAKQSAVTLEREAVEVANITAEREAVVVTKVSLEKEAVEVSKVSLEKEAVEVSKVSLEKEAVEVSKVSLEKEAVEVSKITAETEAVEVSKATLEKEAVEVLTLSLEVEAIEIARATLEKEALEVAKISAETEAVEVTHEGNAAVAVTSAAEEPQQQAPPPVMDELPPAGLVGKSKGRGGKGKGSRRTAMALFNQDGSQKGEDEVPAVVAIPEVQKPADVSATNVTQQEATPAVADASAASSAADGKRLGKFSWAVCADKNLAGLKRDKKVMNFGKGKPRYEMQDTNTCLVPFVSNTDALFCIFDGHAGSKCATDCLAVFPAAFKLQLESASPLPQLTDATQLFTNAYSVTDTQLSQYEDEGCTAVTLYTWVSEAGQRLIQCANCGDSSAFLFKGGEAVPISVDHKPTTPSERERLSALGIELGDKATRIAGGLAVSRAMGDHFLKQEKTGLSADPSVSAVFPVTADVSHIVLASDGLWDVLTGQQACELLTQNSELDAQELAKLLLDNALQSKKCNDNITIVVLKFK